MCGIAGILRIYPPGVTPPPLFDSIPESWLDTLDASIKHRGPDGQGRFRDRVRRADGCTADIALVHRRLSILDHAGGAQPMLLPPLPEGGGRGVGERLPTPSESPKPLLFLGPPTAPVHYQPIPADPNLLAVVFNGCIYNHRELRKELQAAGHTFHTDHSDTEVLLHGWRAWGDGLCDHLNGMFAYMLWDHAAGTLLRARDPFGEKPLHTFHVAKSDGWINVFSSASSAATSLVAAMGTSVIPIPPATRATDWLRFGWSTASPTPGSRTIEPSHYELSQVSGRPIPHGATHEELATLIPPKATAYGVLAPAGTPSLPRRTSELPLDTLDQLLRSAVHARLESDVPLGVLLSGGVDSGLIARYAREALPDLRTFSVRMPDSSYDESAHAKAAADALGTNHITLDCGAHPAEDLVYLIHTLGLPFGDSSLLATYWVCRAARQHVTVALSGDGGDELFLGYDRYFAPLWLTLPNLLAAPIAERLQRNAEPKSKRFRTGRMLDAAANLGYFDLVSVFPNSLLQRLVNPSKVADQSAILRRARPRSISQAQAFDLYNYLPDDLLRKTDTASMAVALEVRCPFLDRAVVTASLFARNRYLIPDNKRKGLLRQLARKYLPASIVDRPKMGFAIPIGDWFRSDYGGMKTLLLDHLNSAAAFPADLLGLELNRTFIQQMLTEHMSKKRDHSHRLYMLLVLSIWCRWMKRLS